MLKEVKLGLKLLKYSYNFKANIGFMIFFLVLGGANMLLGVDSFIFGSVYIYIGYVMLLQMSYSLMYTRMIPAAPHRKMFELTFPNVMTIVISVLWYLILTVLASVFSSFRPTLRGEYSVSLVIISIFMVICMIYYGICYKFFWLGLILFTFFFSYIFLMGREKITIFLLRNVGADLPACFAVGLVLVFAGSLLSCLLRRIFYKKAISPWAMGANLRKAMQ